MILPPREKIGFRALPQLDIATGPSPDGTALYDAAGYGAGTMMYGDSGVGWISNGTVWQAVADRAWVADFVADVPTLLQVDTTFTVGAGGDYASIFAALADAVKLQPNITSDPAFRTRILIRLLSGFVVTEQIEIRNVDLAHVTIYSDDAVVNVDPTSWGGTSGENRPLFNVTNARAPRLMCRFNLNASPRVSGVIYIGLLMNAGSQCISIPQTGVTTPDDVGFENFTRAIFAAQSSRYVGVRVSGNGCNEAFISTSGAEITLFDARAKDNTLRGLFALRGGRITCVFGLATAMTDSGNFRGVGGVDDASDIVVSNLGVIVIDGTYLGGTSHTPGIQVAAGLILTGTARYFGSGSGGSGRWVVLPDGTMIQYGTVAFTNIATANGALFRSPNATTTWPTPFKTGTFPAVSGTVDASLSSLLCRAPTATDCIMNAQAAATSASATTGRWMAIGEAP